MSDKIYPWKQESPKSAWRPAAVSKWHKYERRNEEADRYYYESSYLYVAFDNTNPLNKQICIVGYDLNNGDNLYDLDITEARYFTGERHHPIVVSVDKVMTNNDPYHVYVFYYVPTDQNRFKVLEIKIDSAIEETDGVAIFNPFTYYFTPPLLLHGDPAESTIVRDLHRLQYNGENDSWFFGGSINFMFSA